MKTIALLLTSIALVSCVSDHGYHDRRTVGRHIPDDTIHPDWSPTPPPMPRPAPPLMDATLVDRFGPPGRIFIPETPRLGEPPREPARRIPSPDVIGSLRPSRTGSLLPRPVRETPPPATIIPRLPSPRPAESTSRITRTSPALRLDRTALSR